MLNHPKMCDLETAIARVNAYKKQGKKVVFTNGCFDILHSGHVDLLARAKQLGDILVIGLNSDESVKNQGKGEDRPFNTYEARAFVLSHLESVDIVVPFTDKTPLLLIEKIIPDILVKGGDWSLDSIVGRSVVEEHGGSVHSLPLIQGFSTTNLADKISKTHKVKE